MNKKSILLGVSIKKNAVSTAVVLNWWVADPFQVGRGCVSEEKKIQIFFFFWEKRQTFILKNRFSNAVHAVGVGLEVPETINGFENVCHVVIIFSIKHLC